jgi:hypothetical protein
MIPLHRFRSLEECKEIQPIEEKGLATMLDIARQKGVVDAQLAGVVRWRAVSLAELALILDGNEARAQELFLMAAEFASRMIRTKELPAPMRITELRPEYSPDTGKDYLVPIERVATLGGARMSVVDFSDALSTLWAFGSDEALHEAARVPEVEYRSSGIEMSEANFKSFEVEKLTALGEEAAALSLIDQIFAELNEALRARFGAVRALLAGDSLAFNKLLMAVIKFHKKDASKRPGRLEGLICPGGMMLSRLALRHGIRVPDQNYLPLRFAPWYSK